MKGGKSMVQVSNVNLSQFKSIGNNLSVQIINPVYIPLSDDKREEIGQKQYEDSNWANLFKSQLVDAELVTRESLTAVVKFAIQDPDVNFIKEFRFLGNHPVGSNPEYLKILIKNDNFKDKGLELIET